MHEQTPAQMPKDGGSVSNAIGLEIQGKDTGPVAEVNASIDFLKKFRPGGPWVLIAIVPDGRITTRTFRPEQIARLREWLDGRAGLENIYFQVNHTGDKSINKKPTKADIVAAEWLHVDIDPNGDPGLFDAERKRLAKKLKEFSPPPSLVIDSGNGFQGFWRLSDPVRVTNPSEEAWADFERYNRQIEADLGADHCHNVDRIMRLPGTVNVPNKKKRKMGRKPCLAAIAHWEDSRHDLSAFRRAPEKVLTKTIRTSSSRVDAWTGPTDTLFLCEALPPWAFRLLHDARDTNGQPFASRSEHVWSFVGACIRDGVLPELIRWCITNPDFAVSAHILDQGNPSRAADRTIARMEVACEQD